MRLNTPTVNRLPAASTVIGPKQHSPPPATGVMMPLGNTLRMRGENGSSDEGGLVECAGFLAGTDRVAGLKTPLGVAAPGAVCTVI
jgi:hypothetical protein